MLPLRDASRAPLRFDSNSIVSEPLAGPRGKRNKDYIQHWTFNESFLDPGKPNSSFHVRLRIPTGTTGPGEPRTVGDLSAAQGEELILGILEQSQRQGNFAGTPPPTRQNAKEHLAVASTIPLCLIDGSPEPWLVATKPNDQIASGTPLFLHGVSYAQWVVARNLEHAKRFLTHFVGKEEREAAKKAGYGVDLWEMLSGIMRAVKGGRWDGDQYKPKLVTDYVGRTNGGKLVGYPKPKTARWIDHQKGGNQQFSTYIFGRIRQYNRENPTQALKFHLSIAGVARSGSADDLPLSTPEKSVVAVESLLISTLKSGISCGGRLRQPLRCPRPPRTRRRPLRRHRRFLPPPRRRRSLHHPRLLLLDRHHLPSEDRTPHRRG